MAEIINIPNFGEARLSLKEYNEMRDKIKELEESNARLTEILDHVCDENKVRQRRQIIRVRELTFNPHALGQKEIIDEKLINLEEIEKDFDQRVSDIEKDWKCKADEMKADKESISRALELCQREKIDIELELMRLKKRGWWQRLWNK